MNIFRHSKKDETATTPNDYGMGGGGDDALDSGGDDDVILMQ